MALWLTSNSGRGLDVCKLSRSGAARLMLQGQRNNLCGEGIRHHARLHLGREQLSGWLPQSAEGHAHGLGGMSHRGRLKLAKLRETRSRPKIFPRIT